MKPQPQENHALKADHQIRRCRYAEPVDTDYRKVWHLQQQIVAARNDGRLDTDILLLLEHPPVFTMGRRGGLANLVVSQGFLVSQGIDMVQIERGGDITYHGPGQLVGYPMVNLRQNGLSVVDFVARLEAVMIRTATEYGVAAQVDPRNRGAWVDDRKLGSIGIAVRRGITFHGFALNVNTDLTPFQWVNPCGLEGVGVTSLADENKAPVPMADARAAVCRSFETVMDMRLTPLSMPQLQHLMEAG